MTHCITETIGNTLIYTVCNVCLTVVIIVYYDDLIIDVHMHQHPALQAEMDPFADFKVTGDLFSRVLVTNSFQGIEGRSS